MSANNAVLEHINNTFEMEMDNEIFKQNNADQVKGNATKLEYTNYCENVNGSPSFIQKFLIKNQIIHNYSEQAIAILAIAVNN